MTVTGPNRMRMHVSVHHHFPSRVPQKNFGLLGAVHVAGVLAGEQIGRVGPHRAEFDEEYLESVGVLDELPRFRELSEEMRGVAC